MTQTARLHPPPRSFGLGLDQHPLLHGTHAPVLQAQLQPRRVEAGATLLSEGEVPEGVVFLITGSVRAIVTADDGRRALIRLIRAPGLLGGLELSTGATSSVSYVTMEVARIALLSAARWQLALGQCPELRRRWLVLVAEEQRAMVGRYRSVVFGHLEERLAELVLRLVETYGLPVPGGRRIRVRLRHEDLADFLGAARRSVTRILTDWRNRGWIFHDGGSFTVADSAALAEIAGEVTAAIPLRGDQKA